MLLKYFIRHFRNTEGFIHSPSSLPRKNRIRFCEILNIILDKYFKINFFIPNYEWSEDDIGFIMISVYFFAKHFLNQLKILQK